MAAKTMFYAQEQQQQPSLYSLLPRSGSMGLEIQQKVPFSHPEYELDEAGCLVRKGSEKTMSSSDYRCEELISHMCRYMASILTQVFDFDKVVSESTHAVYTSKGWSIQEKLLVFICSSRHLSPGVFSRSVLVKYGLGYGSMIPYLIDATEKEYGIVLVHSVGSTNMDSIMQSIWEEYIFATAAHKINFVTYGYGGLLMMRLFESNLYDMRARLGGISFIESSHRINKSTRRSLRHSLSQRAILWETSASTDFGQEVLKSPRSDAGCICLSAGRRDSCDHVAYTAQIVKDAVFRFFAAAPPSAFEFARSEARLAVRRRVLLHPSKLEPVTYATTMTIEDFELLRVIGKGAFGKVMLVRRKDEGRRMYAMKVLKKVFLINKNQVEHTKAERRILQSIDHPFIVKLRFAFQNPDKLYLVMDYYNGGNLYFHLRKRKAFRLEIARFLSAQLLLAIAHLHSLDIAYRDLKLENILVDSDGYLALTDFGLSREDATCCTVNTFCGTAEYIAPELLQGHAYGPSVDWWSFGILLYEMLCGETPFYAPTRKTTFYNILHKDVTFPSSSSCFSDEAKSLVRALLTRNPKQRLGSGPNRAQELMDHPFFASIHWDLLYKKEIQSPFRVRVTGDADISNISTLYTREKAQDSVVHEKVRAEQQQDHLFEDFSYMDDSIIDCSR